MDRDRGVPRILNQRSIDPPTRKFGVRNSGRKKSVGSVCTSPIFEKGESEMKAKVLLAMVALSCAPLGMAGNKAEYPSEKVGEFVVEKLDVTSLPSVFRPKKEKGKKTFADYGFTTQKVDENETIIEA